jgi:hypothetical protein
MALPPTPGSLLASSRLLAAWGTRVDTSARSPIDKLAELIASRFEVPLAESLEELHALSAEHRYVIAELLGASRHSAVYAAVDSLLARYVAVKIHRAEGDDADYRVLAEARAASQLNHPNVVQVYDLGKHDGWLFSVTELCDEDMNTYCLRHGWLDILARIIEAGEGLARLHEAGIIHGDVKPANILIMNGVARLADFGMASSPGRSTNVVGTPGYIAPEVAAGIRSESGDVFALATTAWACLFGGLPYGPLPPRGDLAAAIQFTVDRAREGAFAEPLREYPGMPQLIVDEIKCGLCWDPAGRPSLDLWLGRLKVLHAWGRRRARLRARLPWAEGWSSRRSLAFAAAFVLVFGGVSAYLAVQAGDHDGAMARGSLGARAPVRDLLSTSPRIRIEVAARAGEGDTAVLAISQAWEMFDQFSRSEQIQLAHTGRRAAEELEQKGQRSSARLVRLFAVEFEKRLGLFDEASLPPPDGRGYISPSDRPGSK